MDKNNEQPVTWDRIADKLNQEYQEVRAYTPPDTDPALLSYFKVAAAYIHRYLKEYRIPSELYGTVSTRDKILGQIVHHWMDEAVKRGGDTRDKEDVASKCVESWLNQVRREEQEAILEGMNLHERSLVFSEVELTASGKSVSFYIGGIPDVYDIDSIEQYRDFIEDIPPHTGINVTTSSWRVGHGESEDASRDEVSFIAGNQDLLEQEHGIEAVQIVSFLVITPCEYLELDDDEPLEDMEI